MDDDRILIHVVDDGDGTDGLPIRPHEALWLIPYLRDHPPAWESSPRYADPSAVIAWVEAQARAAVVLAWLQGLPPGPGRDAVAAAHARLVLEASSVSRQHGRVTATIGQSVIHRVKDPAVARRLGEVMTLHAMAPLVRDDPSAHDAALVQMFLRLVRDIAQPRMPPDVEGAAYVASYAGYFLHDVLQQVRPAILDPNTALPFMVHSGTAEAFVWDDSIMPAEEYITFEENGEPSLSGNSPNFNRALDPRYVFRVVLHKREATWSDVGFDNYFHLEMVFRHPSDSQKEIYWESEPWEEGRVRKALYANLYIREAKVRPNGSFWYWMTPWKPLSLRSPIFVIPRASTEPQLPSFVNPSRVAAIHVDRNLNECFEQMKYHNVYNDVDDDDMEDEDQDKHDYDLRCIGALVCLGVYATVVDDALQAIESRMGIPRTKS